MFRAFYKRIDWILIGVTLPIVLSGIISMTSFGEKDYFTIRQIIWLLISYVVFFLFSLIDWRFLRRTLIIVILYGGTVAVLAALFMFGIVSRGAQSWFTFGLFSVQPTDVAKIMIIIILAKYFSRRHIEIAHFRHIIVSGVYALIPFLLVLVQPDFGSAVTIFLIWLGMIMVSGVSKKHLLAVFLLASAAILVLWFGVFAPYQKARITSFLNPLADPQGAGYNALQSTIAVGSGGVLGKGVGYGTQSRLRFLPEYQTDFIFAAFAEEWGFIGVILLFSLYGILFWRIGLAALHGASNFEILYAVGVAIFFMSHFVISVGMNIGLLPVTGITIPLMSYGGSHLVVEFAALGIMMGMRSYARGTHYEDSVKEFLGVEQMPES